MLNRTITLNLLLCLLVLPFFFVAGPDYYSTDSFKYFWNFGHPIFFALANIALLKILARQRKISLHLQCAIAVIFTAIAGLSIELVQSNFSRNPDIGDFCRNFLGLMIALFWFSTQGRHLAKANLYTGRAVSLLGSAYMLISMLNIYATEYTRLQRLPQLLSFESTSERQQISANNRTVISSDFAAEGAQSLKIYLDRARYSGLSIRKIPSDWSHYQKLALSLYNPTDEPIKLTLRIDDLSHSRNPKKGYSDRFNRQIALSKGWTHWQIPLADIAGAPRGRSLNTQQISNIGLFSSHLSKPRIVYLDNLRLLRENINE